MLHFRASFLAIRSAPRFRSNTPWIIFLTFFLGITSSVDSQARADSKDRPNVVLILTDDQGWGDLAGHGNEKISTPALDKLASESVRLERFYVSPVCAPTRAALLTGRYPERSGVAGVTGRREVMRTDETTMAEVFRDAGYVTGCFGKWHNGAQMPLHPNGQGFDEFFGFCGGHFNLYNDPLLEKNGVPVQTTGYITDVLADAAIEFIETQREKPFFCYVPFNAPHGPFQVSKDLFEKYNDGSIDEKTAAVYAMVENIDSNVARILETLDRLKITKDTIVLFLTDNGPNGKRYNGGMRGAKGSVHEGGCRVPCFIRWPDRIQSQSIDQITAHIDLLPTLSQWCGLSPTEEVMSRLDGRSLNKLIANGSDPLLIDRSVLTYRPNQLHLEKFGKAAVRTQTHRLTIEKGKPALFDMTTDPSQTLDISDRESELVKQLTATIQEYVTEITPQISTSRPVPISPDRPTLIPSVDASLVGLPGFADEISWSHSWVDRWTSPNDEVSWTIDVSQAGRYQISMHYVCDSESAKVTARSGDQQITEKLPRFAMEPRVRPDLDSNSSPRRMLTFRERSLGTMTLAAGVSTITLQREDESGAMIELGGLTVTRCDIPPQEDFHLFLLAGQSNMAGRGIVEPQDKMPDARILMLDRHGKWVPATDPLHFDKKVAGVGMGREFARMIASQQPGVTIGLVPCAVGGSPVSTWMPGALHPQTHSHPYDDAKERIEIALKSGTFHGILWHQGESDSNPKRAPTYKDSLVELFGRFRALLGEDMPIVLGQLPKGPSKPWSDSRKAVDRAHQEIAKELPLVEFVVSDDLTLKSDNTHFDRESLLRFGRRYAAAFLKLSPNK